MAKEFYEVITEPKGLVGTLVRKSSQSITIKVTKKVSPYNQGDLINFHHYDLKKVEPNLIPN